MNNPMTNPNLPRGIRNNNPGNIRRGASNWQGMRENGFDPEFIEFTDPVWGLRALMKLLLTYYTKYGLDTVHSIVNRWAPPHENATDHYAGHVAQILGVGRTDALNVPELLVPLAKAITRHENGTPPRISDSPPFWYEEAVYEKARRLALGIADKSEAPPDQGFFFPLYETKSKTLSATC